MVYDQREAWQKYLATLEAGYLPLLCTTKDTWNIHPENTRDLVFLPDRVEFFTLIAGKPRHIQVQSVDYEDIMHDKMNGEDVDEEEDL